MRWIHGAAVLALAVAVAGCGSETPGEDVGGLPGETAELAFAECMRDQGYDWPDPQLTDGGWDTHVEQEIDYESPEFVEAERVCAEVRQEAAASDPASDGATGLVVEEELEAKLRFAACMRDHGIDFPDPVLEDDGVISGPAGPMEGVDAPAGVQEAFEEAWEVCEAEQR